MPYPSHQRHRMPTTRETTGAEFARADGQVETQDQYSKVTGSSPDADIDARIVHRKVELTCGCYWPDVEIGGVCALCIQKGTGANVCKTHYTVCDCGTPCCWKHSHATDDPKTRECERCHLREKNKAMKEAVLGFFGRLARRIFFKNG